MATPIYAAQNALVEAHLGLVKPIAVRIARSLPRRFEIDDLVGAGNVGLVSAARRYRPGNYGGIPFACYARAVVRGFILASVRRGAYLEAIRPGLVEVPEPSAAPDLVTAIDEGRRRRRLRAAVERLPGRQRRALNLHYEGALSLRKIAGVVGVGRARARELHKDAIARLRMRLAG